MPAAYSRSAASPRRPWWTRYKFAHDLKTGKHTKAHSFFGLLLTILGLKKANSGPLFDKPAKTR